MPRITFPQRGRTVDAEPGLTLLDAARRAGLELESPCNGLGTCGKCRVTVDRPAAVRRLGEEASQGADVLACHAEVLSEDLQVTFPETVRGKDRVLLSGSRVERPLRPWVTRERDAARGVTRVLRGGAVVAERPGDAPVLGLAVDIGTTTLVAAVLDLADGRELETVGALNPQTRLGHDVLARIQIGSEPPGLQELHDLLAAELRRITAEALRRAGASPDDLHDVVVAGNTAMLHLAAGVDPRTLGRYPYTPALRGGVALPAAELHLLAATGAEAWLPPVLDGFVGADITAGVLATGLHELPGVTLFVDVGTNGEMVLAVDGRLVATSTAAGPAFEGMNIGCGMRAALGAIEKVRIGADGVEAHTIGAAPARGVCGSGLVDAVSEMVRTGIVDGSGRFARPEALPPHLAAALVPWKGKLALRLAGDADAPAGPVVLTQHDVRQVQLAKGAVRAGIEALLAHERLAPEQVDRVLLAGSFGAHLQPASLAGIGLLPPGLGDRVTAVGNTSRTGAELLLLDHEARAELCEVARAARVVDLAHAPGFEKVFVRALAFPPRPEVRP